MNQDGLTDDELAEAVVIMREDKARFLAALEADPPHMAEEELRKAISHAYYILYEMTDVPHIVKLTEDELKVFNHLLECHLYDVMEGLYAHTMRQKIARRIHIQHPTANTKGGTA